MIRRAVELLRGEGLPPEEADERRERLLAGFRWILVDEYQDIGSDQYALISALAGRTLDDESGKLTLFAVGDDDQNIYAFNGTSVEFIRRFEADYGPRPIYLTDNYRSTGHIIAAANAMIEPARGVAQGRVGRHRPRGRRVALHGHQDRHATYRALGTAVGGDPARIASPDRTRPVCVSQCPLSAPGAADERSDSLGGSACLGHPSGSDDDAWLSRHGENHSG